MIQDQKPDMILFTGDLVNQDKDEINPYISLFGKLVAPFGKYAVLGNHDYYGQPSNKSERKAYWDDFFEKYKEMGFDLIMNDHRYINKENQRIALIGVENWGGGRWFPKKGDLDKALNGVSTEEFCLLMSHDPTHWDEKVLPHERHIDLTLSGHTHGMQFGINLKGLRWSPVKYRYKKWIGLHEEKGQKLYINRGFGFLGFPGRVGMWPEITIITLEKDV
jgi:predicted MPP superfamily phosphohydrolase